MPEVTILLADNDPDFLNTRADSLRRVDYRVILADSLGKARRRLKQGQVDIAVLDIRLVDDDDEKDISGLTLAKDAASSVPKIILTSFPTVEAVRMALSTGLSGLSPAVDFVDKREGPEALIAAIRRAVAVHIKKQPKQVSLNLSEQLEKDFEEARRQAYLIHRVRLMLVAVGAMVIIGGIIGVLLGYATAGALGAVAGMLTEGLAALFSRFAEDANKRMDRYHRQLLEIYMKS